MREKEREEEEEVRREEGREGREKREKQTDSEFAHATLSAWKSEDNGSHFSPSTICVPGSNTGPWP